MSFVTRMVVPNFDPDPGWTREKIGNYVVEWTGVKPTLAEVLAQAEPSAASILASKKAFAKTLLTSDDPAMTAVRNGDRLIMQMVQSKCIDKLNEIIGVVNAKLGTNIATVTKSTWAQLLSSNAALIDSETDPTR